MNESLMNVAYIWWEKQSSLKQNYAGNYNISTVVSDGLMLDGDQTGNLGFAFIAHLDLPVYCFLG